MILVKWNTYPPKKTKEKTNTFPSFWHFWVDDFRVGWIRSLEGIWSECCFGMFGVVSVVSCHFCVIFKQSRRYTKHTHTHIHAHIQFSISNMQIVEIPCPACLKSATDGQRKSNRRLLHAFNLQETSDEPESDWRAENHWATAHNCTINVEMKCGCPVLEPALRLVASRFCRLVIIWLRCFSWEIKGQRSKFYSWVSMTMDDWNITTWLRCGVQCLYMMLHLTAISDWEHNPNLTFVALSDSFDPTWLSLVTSQEI